MTTSPGRSARPARPATCRIVCASRSWLRGSVPNSPWSAFSTPTSVTRGKSWPFVEHLRADQDVDVRPLATSSSTRRQRAFAAACCRGPAAPIARAAETAPRARRRRAACLRRPRSARRRTSGTTIRACACGAAVMAAQLARARVHRETRVAARALLARPCSSGQNSAGAKPRRFKNSSTWLPAARCCADRGDERRRQRLAARVPLQVDDPHARHARRADPPRHLELAIAPLRRALREALERRRRRAEHAPARRAGCARTTARSRARIAEAALLLVRGVVLLVDDDRARPRAAARTPPTACRRRAAPRRAHARATRRSARAR